MKKNVLETSTQSLEPTPKRRWLTNREFRRIQARIDAIGMSTAIVKQPKGGYLYNINFHTEEFYKTRESARRAIVRLYNERFPKEAIAIRDYKTKEDYLKAALEVFKEKLTKPESTHKFTVMLGIGGCRNFANDYGINMFVAAVNKEYLIPAGDDAIKFFKAAEKEIKLRNGKS